MRMPREARAILRGNVVAEVVKQQKRIGFGGVIEPEGPMQVNPSPFHGGLGLHDALDWTNGHEISEELMI
jgi:predicted aconitase with swiveling domain